MTDNTELTTKPGPFWRPLMSLLMSHLMTWRAIMLMAAIVIVAGLALNWTWLMAIGVAPLLLSVLPCLVMCGVGVCMSCRKGGGGK